jgi:oligopeptide/dipeptide ABC transporter ATP-binding protein
VRAVDGVDLAISPGETLALVGESGSGKSTLGRVLLYLEKPTVGDVVFEGTTLRHLNARALRRQRRRMQMVFQDPYGSLNPQFSVGDTLAEPLALHGLHAGDRVARVAQLLELVGLSPALARRHPHEFSGGQRQRIAIARALAVEPRLIVCDEPVSALDVSIQAQVLNLLEDLQERFAMAYLFIAHDLAVVKHIADRVAVMYLGRIVEEAPTDMLFSAPRHPYTQALLASIPLARVGQARASASLSGDPPSPLQLPSGCRFHPRCAHARAVCRSEDPLLNREGGHASACHLWKEIAVPSPLALPSASAHLQVLSGAFSLAQTSSTLHPPPSSSPMEPRR